MILINNEKVTTSIKASLYREWGCLIAYDLFDQKQIIQSRYLNYVHWDGLRLAMALLLQMYSVWATKHVSGVCATNR